MKTYRGIVPWRAVAFSMLFLLLLAACSRGDVGKGLAVKVIDETEDTTPFGSEAQGAERAPGAGYDVYLTPADTPMSDLARVQSGWRRLVTDEDGQAVFPDIEGRFHALVDVNGNGRIDQRALNVPSGSVIEIVVSALAGGEDGDNWLQLTLDRRTYFPGGDAEVAVIGWLAGDDGEPVYLDLWYQDGNDETRLLRKDLGAYSGDVSLTTAVMVEHDWPVTPEDTANDFLLVPRAFGKYYSGARFSVRGLEESIAITNIGLTINGGNAETASRNVTLALTAENADTVAFGEDLDDLLGGAPRYPFQEEYGYQLSAGDGPKTVYAVFFDRRGDFAGPVEDSIILNAEGPPPAPVTNMSVTINGGDAVAPERMVTLTFAADNADRIAFGEDPDVLETARRVQFATEYNFQLSAGDVTKTVYAMFFNTRGEAAGPVSDSILLRAEGPSRPVAALLHVVENPPGTDDELWGEPGATDPHTTIRVYSDMELTNLLGTGSATADGSFDLVNIRDGSVPGNVFKPGDYVFVTAVDFLGRESLPATVVNDSTAPVLYRDQVQGRWVAPAPPASWLGNPGNTFQAFYQQPVDDPGADDVTGGYVDFSDFGGGANVPLIPQGGGLFVATMVLGYSEPHGTHLAIDSMNLRLRMKLFDAAGNESAWVTSESTFVADNIVPDPPVVAQPRNGNRELGLYWPHPVPFHRNYDLESYHLVITEQTSGAIVFDQEFTLELYVERLFLGNGQFVVAGLPNCRDYVIRVASIDDARNRSNFSVPVTGTTILPPPEFEAWGGVTTDDGGVVTFGMKSVDFANAYEVHFSDERGVPYSFTTPGGDSSPRMVGNIFSPPAYTDRIEELAIGTELFLAPRSIDEDDPTCFSEYGPEVTAVSDLKILSTSDGDAEDSIGGALAATYWGGGADLDLLVGAPYAKEVVVLDPRADNSWLGSFGTFDIPISYDIPGKPLAVVDLKGDGEPWYVVGSPRESPSDLLLAGRVRVYDSTGTEQFVFDGDAVGLHFGFSVANLGDLDGSGGENFAVGGFGCLHGDCGAGVDGFPSQGPGKVIIFGYHAGDDDIVVIREHGLHDGLGSGDMFGISIFGGVDLGPGFENTYAIGSPGTGLYSPVIVVRWYHGATGDIIGRLDSRALTAGEPPGRMIGAAIVAVDDISGDGLPDWIVGMPWRSSIDSGAIVAVGSDLEDPYWLPLWTLSGELARASARFGSVLASGGDVNGDGFPSVIVGAPGGLQDYFYGPGSAYAVDAQGGRLTYEIRGGALDGSVGYSVLLPGSLLDGGYDEWVVGAPGSAYGGTGSGRVYVLTSDPSDP